MNSTKTQLNLKYRTVECGRGSNRPSGTTPHSNNSRGNWMSLQASNSVTSWSRSRVDYTAVLPVAKYGTGTVSPTKLVSPSYPPHHLSHIWQNLTTHQHVRPHRASSTLILFITIFFSLSVSIFRCITSKQQV